MIPVPKVTCDHQDCVAEYHCLHPEVKPRIEASRYGWVMKTRRADSLEGYGSSKGDTIVHLDFCPLHTDG